MKTVVYVAIDVDFPGTHGGSTHVGEAVHSLAKLCQRVYLICKRKKGQSLVEKQAKCTIVRIPSSNLAFLRVLSYCLVPFLVVLCLLITKKIDMIYERGRIFGGGGILAGCMTGKKTVYEIIEPYTIIPVILGDVKENALAWKGINKWHSFIVNRASLVTVTHKSSVAGIHHKRVLFIHTGADPEKFRPEKASRSLVKKYSLVKGKALLYIGSFSRWHGCEYMIRAVAQLAKKDKEIKLMMVGGGQKLQACMRLAKTLGVQENVIFPGKVALEKVPEYINASDICLALFDRQYPPFRKLGYYYSPIKIHEYKACGKPVIASDYPLVREIIKDGVNGFLVDETKISELAAAMKKLMQAPQLMQKMGRKNREEVEKIYNWDHFNEKIVKKLSEMSRL